MTTEQCSVDSLLPKNRTETFARQLQNRLRTLSAESERDGLEDTSWNGDQLSSSSDNDIYYDLDSSPGSPAEEATEVDYAGYINVKNSDSIYPSSSGNDFLNHTQHSSNSSDKVDGQFLGQIYRSNNLNNCNSFLGATGFKLNKLENEYESCDQCLTSQNSEGVSIPQLKENASGVENKYSNSSKQNGFFHLGQSLNDQLNLMNKNEPPNQINGFNHVSSPEIIQEDTHLENTVEPSINDRLLNVATVTNEEILNGHTDHENSQNYNFEINLNSCCNCDKLNNAESVDVNCNSDNNNDSSICINDTDAMISILEILQSSVSPSVSEEQFESCKSVNSDPKNVTEECRNESKSEPKNIQTNSKQYTEDDLCRLVDAVFSRSQDEICDELSETQNKTNDSEFGKRDSKDDDDEEEEIESIESKRSKFRRCSSLKTGKTPPGTPGRKKIVRFADVFGLDLADVRTFLDEVPKVPKSAFLDLKNVELSSSPPVNISPLDYFRHSGMPSLSNKVQRTIVPFFQQPSSRPDFLDRVRDNFVCLENAIISDPVLSVITGIVRVKNIDFHKSVHIRYSIDNWKSYADLQAKYVPNSCDGFSDKFSFMLYAHMLNIGQRLEFAVRYHTKGSLFWDGNFGANYTFQCVPDSPSKFSSASYVTPSPSESWATFY